MSDKTHTVLIVDDVPEDRVFFRRYLQQDEQHTYSMLEADSGDLAIQMFREQTPDCILLDYKLQDMDGLEILDALRELDGTHGCAIVMLTGVGHTDLAVEAMKRGAHDYLDKSRLSPEDLQRTVANAIARSELQCKLERQREWLDVTLSAIGDAVIATDVEGRITFMNRMAETLTGWEADAAIQKPVHEVVTIIDEVTRKVAECPVTRLIRGDVACEKASQDVLVRLDGGELAIDDSAAPIRDAGNNVIGAVMVFRDVTEQRRLTQQLLYQATHDPLTGLVNRKEFERRLELILQHAAENETQHALCYLDLDQFKVVNDSCGHVAGDELLRQLTALLKGRMRERDTLARLGGDEFGLLLGECGLEPALRVANELRQVIQDFRFTWEDKAFAVGASIGLVPLTDSSGSLSNVLILADQACYTAKEKGRNRVHVCLPEFYEQARQHAVARPASRIHRALEENRFRLYYQPVAPAVEDGDNHPYGEILLRMLDEQGGLVLPESFIPPAERYYRMCAIDRWVVQNVFSRLQGRLAGTRLAVAINLSGQSLGDKEFLGFVMKLFRTKAVPPQSLCFEITESAAITNPAQALRFINVLRDRGCRFALDNFGKGLSSFEYLKTLPVDFLKIDGSFVKGIGENPVDESMVAAIQHIGRTMGVKTVAESVESDEVLRRLKHIGIDYVQGFAIAPPQALEDIIGRDALVNCR
jgi:diguanylate cyclase (GGDEF)-like protein/PAS domain S-box-containing protein